MYLPHLNIGGGTMSFEAVLSAKRRRDYAADSLDPLPATPHAAVRIRYLCPHLDVSAVHAIPSAHFAVHKFEGIAGPAACLRRVGPTVPPQRTTEAPP